MTDHFRDILISIGLSLGIIAYIPYILHVFQRKTKPHFCTWFIWAVSTIIVFIAQWSDHAGAGSYITALTGLTSVIVTILSIFWGEKTITRTDKISFVIALLIIPLWVLTATPIYSLFLIIVIEILAFYPTIRKSWHKPKEESLTLYWISFIKFVIAVVTLENYTVVTTLYPAFWVLGNGGFTLYALWRRKELKVKNNVSV